MPYNISDNLNNRLTEIKTSLRQQELSQYGTPAGIYAFKCAILIIYAHWEGFIKFSSTYYLNSIKDKNYDFSSVKNVFWSEYKKVVTNDTSKLLDDMISGNFLKTGTINTQINTGGNLKYSIFQGNILKRIGFEYHEFMKLIFNDVIKLLLQNDKFTKDPSIRRKINSQMNKGSLYQDKEIYKIRTLLRPYKLTSLSSSISQRDIENLEIILKYYINQLVDLRNNIAHGEKLSNPRDKLDVQVFGGIIIIILSKYYDKIEESLAIKDYKKV